VIRNPIFLIYISTMSPNARYWTLHWLRVALWPLPLMTLLRAGRRALNLMHT